MTKYLTELWDLIRLNPKKSVIRLLLALAAIGFVFGDYGLATRISMELENRKLEKLQAEEQEKIVELRSTIKNAYQPDSVEKVARERFNFHKKARPFLL
ncbi:septum formation initiator family protein [Chlorobaculum sp. MV4-Y]|uniref:septum formation initiator family protein n=1 Tax=Chlorobaculum sp. MV4-Y TaxID=2976335 RepID=UPI0021AF32D5|nr:septum formation initiator family protein [Chlorobaculum sp. MV4-Y]UWX57783.1 septum formation initiator family protein [Chlorobaculum sp. MV4-Y]